VSNIRLNFKYFAKSSNKRCACRQEALRLAAYGHNDEATRSSLASNQQKIVSWCVNRFMQLFLAFLAPHLNRFFSPKSRIVTCIVTTETIFFAVSLYTIVPYM
jgi:hypothetical protein